MVIINILGETLQFNVQHFNPMIHFWKHTENLSVLTKQDLKAPSNVISSIAAPNSTHLMTKMVVTMSVPGNLFLI